MENVDLAVLNTALEWLKEDDQIVLVTVAKTWGSSPRPAGSMMVWRRNGAFQGSLSGGCIEEELLQRFAVDFPRIPQIVEFGISKEQAVSRGLPCGGEVSVVVETLKSGGLVGDILAGVRQRERVQRVVDIDSGKSWLETPQVPDRTRIAGRRFHAVYEPKWRLLVIGAGQLSALVTQFAEALGYEVVVCDPRENYRHSWLDGEVELFSTMPDDFINAQACDAQTAVLALTHDPKLDDLAIIDALNSDSFYVGALGSSRTNGARRERLREHFEISDEQLAFMSGPIGLDLNTRTASEIALGIMTEITARRNGVTLSSERQTVRETSG